MRALLKTVAIAAVLATGAGAALAQPPRGDLIPRKVLFGNPSRSAATISPDGRSIAFLAPRDGVMNVWVAPLGAIEQAKPLTTETGRPIRQYFWSPDSSRVLYIQDKGGTEDFLLYGTARADGQTTSYTPFAKTRVELIQISPEVKDSILIGLNNRDPKWHDIYRLNLSSGVLTKVWQNPGGYAGVVADRKLNLVLAQKSNPDGGFSYERFGPGQTLTKAFQYGLDDSQTTSVIAAPNSGRVYMLDSRGRDTAALTTLDLASGKSSVLAQDPRADISSAIEDPRTGELLAYSVDYLTSRWTALSPSVQGDIAFLDRETRGQWAVQSQSQDNRLWTIAVDRVTESPAAYLYDRSAKQLTKLFSARPELEGRTLAAMYPREIKARDGRTLVSYLTLPPASDPDGDGRPNKAVPMVLFVHGGPWGRDEYGYNGSHQWLANRGYAVLSVNYRASTGFGKGFIKAGDLQWGRAMHDDLLDAVDWAVKQGVAQPDKVAIMGGSYGGYATLAGMTMTPDRFACGVDIVGPSNLFTLLQTIPAYWQSTYEQFAKRMGDPRTEAGRALLKERSPLTYVSAIKRPLLIGQGANDPRVNVRESDQIVAAMKAKGIPVTYVLYPDEGHGFQRPQNRISFNAVAEGFLSTCLGGAAEPIGSDFQGSSLQVPEGARHVAGLEAALPHAASGAVAAPAHSR